MPSDSDVIEDVIVADSITALVTAILVTPHASLRRHRRAERLVLELLFCQGGDDEVDTQFAEGFFHESVDLTGGLGRTAAGGRRAC